MLNKSTIALTGVTGLLGRNLFLEILKQNRNNLSEIKFIIFGRDSKEDSLKTRLIKILEEELIDYIDDLSFDFKQIYHWLETNVKLINYKLDQSQLAISSQDLIFLEQSQIDFFFHIAALTDLRNGQIVKENVERTNIFGTKNLLELITRIKKVNEFIYVGTAYCCGNNYGEIEPDFVNQNGQFRNHYEKAKLEGELLVRSFAKKTGQKCRYFRPSVVSGRMIEKKLGAVSKFDVFYGWALFFLNLKRKYVKNLDNLITEKCHINLRYLINPNSGLNIVPVDYCAKIIYWCCADNYPELHIHLTYDKEIPHSFYFPLILKSLNISGVEAIYNSQTKENQNVDEKLYEKSIGMFFTSYMTSKPMNFKLNNLEKLIKIRQIKLPNLLNAENFNILLDYAKNKKYGIC